MRNPRRTGSMPASKSMAFSRGSWWWCRGRWRSALIYYVLYQINFVLAFLWNVVIVYFTLGFRQFSHYFTDIHLALNNDDVPRAREMLSEWTGLDTVDMPVSEIVRHTLMSCGGGVASACVRRVLLVPDSGRAGGRGVVSHRRISGALVGDAERDRIVAFSRFAQQAFFVIDWVPARLTSLGFAIVGNFEDAIYAWRNHARQWPDANEGVLLAAGSGALGRAAERGRWPSR